jgi:SpoVK/Ycf46/Vps4 family AAA+-type ATPase
VTDQNDPTLSHLLAEIARIDLLVRHEVLRWQAAGQDPDDDFRGLRMSDEDAAAIAARPFGTSWGQTVELEPAEEDSFTSAMQAARQTAEKIRLSARAADAPSRLDQLTAAFGLDRFDLDVLLIALAPTLDTRYERLFGYLQDDITRKRPTINLTLDLLTGAGTQRLEQLSHFNDSAPLFKHRLLERAAETTANKPTLLSHFLVPDETIVAWLLGHYVPRPELGGQAQLLRPRIDETDSLLAAENFAELERGLQSNENDWPLAAFYGIDQASQAAAARQVAARLGRSLLQVNLSGIVSADLPAVQAVTLALRDARLVGAVPCLLGWDACLSEGAPSAEVLAALCDYADLVIVAGRSAWQARGISRNRPLLWLEFPVPSYSQRRDLWSYFVAPATVSHQALDGLAGQFFLTAEQIRDAVASARDAAAGRDEDLVAEDLFAAARAHSNPNLAGLARKITSRYKWSDIILPEDQITILHEVVSTVRGRPKVLEEWGVGGKLSASAGITILFAGQPGTGKTMAAEVIASELGLDLYKIDLSTIVSKYIGETEKNLERIFNEAQTSNAILFFDEADAIFGKRSEVKDAHDRYANIEVSYLLQRMEQYDGVTILATNLRANLDDAFTRRLHFALDFPFPDETYRFRIWQTLFPPTIPIAPDVDLHVMARRFKLAGGNIRNIIVSAAYLAAADGGAVTMAHLLHGARREMQKMGRLIKEKDLTHAPN